MITPDQVGQVREVVASVQRIIILLSDPSNRDYLTTALSLALVWKDQGKAVTVASPMAARQDLEVAGLDLLGTELGNQELRITFPYFPDQVDKVSYHLDEENQIFQLVVRPKSGTPPLDSTKVQLDYAGAEADLVCLVGVNQLADLDYLYTEFVELYTSASTLAIHNFETEYGNVRLSTAGASCISEDVARLLFSLEAPVSAEVGTNLLSTIEAHTDHFRSLAATAETFEVAAQLMRIGARRLRTKVAHEPQPVVESAEVPVAPPVEIPAQEVPRPPKKKKAEHTHQPGDLHFNPSHLK